MFDRRGFLGQVFATVASTPAAVGRFVRSAELLRRAIVIDGQGVIVDPYSDEHASIFSAKALAEHRASGITACSMTLADVGNAPDSYERSIAAMAEYDQVIADSRNGLRKVLDTTDILTAKREGRTGIIFNTQDTAMIGSDLDRIAVLNGLGVRVVQLTYNNRNLAGDGCLELSNAGLSKLGHATVERTENARLVLDLAH